MKCFELTDDRMDLTDSPKGIPSVTVEDCQLYTYETKTQILSPGYVIDMDEETIYIKKPNGTKISSFEYISELQEFIFDQQQCYAKDDASTIYIFDFSGGPPTKIDLKRKPFGWSIVPRSKIIIHWDPMQLYAIGPPYEEPVSLKGHRSRVTTADASESVLVTGDYSGVVRIWYVASWTCHHNIPTGDEPCRQILTDDIQLFVRTENFIHVYDTTTGFPVKRIKIAANDMCITKYGLVVCTGKDIIVYKHGEAMIKVSHRCDSVISTAAERFIASRTGKSIEMRLGADHAEWPAECLDWIRNPSFPFSHNWPTKRYMGILAKSASEWVPKVTHWKDIPTAWIRNDTLRESIWDNLLESNMYVDWSYLPSYLKNKWYQKCQNKIADMITTFEYNLQIIQLIKHIYKETTIRHSSIKEYCWFHHGRVAVIPILLHLTEADHNCSFTTIITKEPVTCDSILSISPHFVSKCLKNDFLIFFIQCLLAYHREYPHKPTEKMYTIFTNICMYIYDKLSADNADIPLNDSGTWKIVDKLGPQHKGCYIRSKHMNGFVTDVVCTPDSKKVYWRPIHRSRELVIDNEARVSVWKFYDHDAPNTLMECAMTMLRTDIWSKTNVIRQFKWFSSENGAFMSESCSVMIFKEAMRITNATWENGVASFNTNTHLTVKDSELMQIDWVVPMWDYCENNLAYIAPLKLKICHVLSTTTRTNIVPEKFAKELFSAISPKTCVVESKWNMSRTVTAIGSQFESIVVGFGDGSIIEYANLSEIEYPIRTYEKHPNAILDISIIEKGFISISEDILCHFCLITGTKLMSMQTNMVIIGIIPFEKNIIGILEAENIKGFITVWDFELETRINRLQIAVDMENVLTANNIIVTNNRVYYLTPDDIEHVFTLNIGGAITCIVDIGYGICGGTSEGVIFKWSNIDQSFEQWWHGTDFSITSMARISTSSHIVSGTSSGQLTMWDHENIEQVVSTDITNSPITHIFTEGMFAMISTHKKLTLTSIVYDRCILAVHVLNSIIFWSHKWKTRLLRECNSLLKPTIAMCLQYKSAVTAVFELLEECTIEYQDRASWCKPDIIKIIAETIATGESPHAIAILTRIASYTGPKFNCVICNDEDCQDSISMLKTCKHRFHTGCIAELVRKIPEYHNEMQYEYALTVSLKCPICRAGFISEDIQLDTELNKYYNCTLD
jgi:WD40 repeat protein